ncbi:MAG: hypothetical protein HOW73_46235 [Polyangiaceae bacterium]|nr:hypothetical protein [Polyangiaceae bacterium]
MIQHRHHGFNAVGLDEGFMCAELIEVATLLGVRQAALAWFLQHGANGLLPPAALADELGIDSTTFERHYYDGDVRETVERDGTLARDLQLALPTEVTIRGERYVGKLVAERLVADCLDNQ